MAVVPQIRSITPFWGQGVSGPEDPLHFGVVVEILIGPPGASGGNSFDALACTASWLADREAPRAIIGRDLRHLGEGPDFVPGLILMPEWDASALKRRLHSLCEQCAATNWEAAANRLSRYLRWEFDYRYDEREDQR